MMSNEMSERPTPETDAEHQQFAMGGFTLDFCRKLERERDEAREKYSTEATEYMLSVNKLCGERDDARNKLADALQEIDLRTLDFERMKQERDEARELVKTYKDYAQLLGDEISDTAALAYVHGWRSKRHEQGKLLQDKIKQLEAKK